MKLNQLFAKLSFLTLLFAQNVIVEKIPVQPDEQTIYHYREFAKKKSLEFQKKIEQRNASDLAGSSSSHGEGNRDRSLNDFQVYINIGEYGGAGMSWNICSDATEVCVHEQDYDLSSLGVWDSFSESYYLEDGNYTVYMNSANGAGTTMQQAYIVVQAADNGYGLFWSSMDAGETYVSGTFSSPFSNPGCTDQSACNFSYEATEDDGTCCYSNCIQVSLSTTLGEEQGDGWYGNILTVGEHSFTLPDGEGNAWEQLCLDEGVYPVSCDGGSNQDMVWWEIYQTGDNWEELLSGGAPYSANLIIGDVEGAGCTDEGACNHDPEATINDGSCCYNTCATINFGGGSSGENISWNINQMAEGEGDNFWTSWYSGGDDYPYTEEACLNDGWYLISGSSYNSGGGWDGNAVIITDSDGEEILNWSVQDGEEFGESIFVIGDPQCSGYQVTAEGGDNMVDVHWELSWDCPEDLYDNCWNDYIELEEAGAPYNSCITYEWWVEEDGSEYSVLVSGDFTLEMCDAGQNGWQGTQWTITGPTGETFTATGPADGVDCEDIMFTMEGDGGGSETPGCTDETACNYDSGATEDDGSCVYSEPYYDCDGNPVDGESTILSIVDIPNDQGGWVYIQFERSGHDTDEPERNEQYFVERFDEGIGWVSVASSAAYAQNFYTVEATTLTDSTSENDGMTQFRVIASMDEGIWISQNAEGYSVDNIAPSIPTGLLTNVGGGNVDLSWDVSVDEDFNYFSIYRSEDENFTPSYDNLLGNSVEDSFTDIPPSGLEIVYYRVSAVDIHDNEGEPSAIASAVLMSSMSIGYFTAWNIVGLPLSVEDSGYQALFPNAQSGSLYSFDGIYQEQESLEPGVGYLLRMNIEDNVPFTGFPIDELTVDLSSGWNLFSGLSSSISSDAVYSNDIVQSGTIYGLDGLYYNAEAIDPGRGYWVRATEDGEITISSGVSAKQVSFVNRVKESNSISFSNGTHTTELYFGVEIPAEEILSYSLPPRFPQMDFDVRFTGDSKVVMESGEIEIINTNETLILSYNIKIGAGEKMEWVLISETGEAFILEGTGEITVPSEQRFVLNRIPVIPETFTLHQNFPNPFNPITTLSYDLPKDSDVRLAIFDMLGNEVATLVSTSQQAGFKSVQWDATDSMGRAVSAGVYLYQIQAGEFVQTRKMVLLK